MLERLKRALFGEKPVGVPSFGALGVPTGPLLAGDGNPEGLRLLHATATVAEAEMLTSVLTDAGFHIEFVPSAGTAVFGTTGSNSIYVRAEEFEEADRFLKEFLTAEPLPEE